MTAFMRPKGNIHKEIRSMVDGIKITYSRLKKLDSGLLDITTASMKTDEQQTTPSRVKGTGVPKVYPKVSRLMVHPASGKTSLLCKLRTNRRGKSREG